MWTVPADPLATVIDGNPLAVPQSTQGLAGTIAMLGVTVPGVKFRVEVMGMEPVPSHETK